VLFNDDRGVYLEQLLERSAPSWSSLCTATVDSVTWSRLALPPGSQVQLLARRGSPEGAIDRPSASVSFVDQGEGVCGVMSCQPASKLLGSVTQALWLQTVTRFRRRLVSWRIGTRRRG